MEEPMIDVLVIHSDRENNRTEPFGRKKFRQLPRVGECIEFIKGDAAHLYRVVAVHHPGSPASMVGDIYVVDVGETATMIETYHSKEHR
jgi:hypothetical protein